MGRKLIWYLENSNKVVVERIRLRLVRLGGDGDNGADIRTDIQVSVQVLQQHCRLCAL